MKKTLRVLNNKKCTKCTKLTLYAQNVESGKQLIYNEHVEGVEIVIK